MTIRKLNKSEYTAVAELALSVFTQCGKADFNADGLETFRRFIYNEQLMHELTISGAFEQGLLVGIMGTKDGGKHISVFFIAPEFHRQGIGKRLFEFVYRDREPDVITVNSSSFAVKFYESLGFVKIANEQETDGLKYTPMRRSAKNP